MLPATDRLSTLPETLITAILSLVPLKDAVRTSVLARAWRRTWRSRANVEITESHFPSVNHFLYFTRQWLLTYPHQTIERFSLTLTSEPPETDRTGPLLEWFVWFALAHEAKSLDLDFPRAVLFDLPEFVYDYDALDHLRLVSCNFDVSAFVNLSWLKTASLGRVSLQNDALRALLKGCPLLEGLSLFECEEGSEYVVVSPRMRSLEIDSCGDLVHLIVVTQRLNRFKYVGRLIEFDLIDVGEIQEADLDLGETSFYDDETGESVQNLLVSFCGVKVLRVCAYVTQVLATVEPDPWRLPQELRVKHLIFKSAFHHYEFVGIACLLISCPSLEKVQFDVVAQHIFEDDEDHPCSELETDTFWGEDLGAPNSIRSCLQEVEINGFGGSENEVRFLKFLYNFGSELRTVRVRVARDDGGAWVQLSQDYSRILRSYWRSVSIHRLNIVVE